MICEICGQFGTRRVCEDYDTLVGGVPMILSFIPRFHCDNCGEDYFTPEDLEILRICRGKLTKED
jgi:YgiT-type zinc finger domain-containing protein